MKKSFIVFSFIVSSIAYSQVGINTTEPKATLDVTINTTDPTKADGIIAPRVKGSELKIKDSKYTEDQKGTILYVTEALAIGNTTVKTANVTEVGYYYFDGTIWKSFKYGTLEEVVEKGNYSPKYITFIGSTELPLRDGAIAEAQEMAESMVSSLQKGGSSSGGGSEAFFTQSAINFLSSCIYFFAKFENGKYSDLPHILSFMNRSYQDIFDTLFTNEEIYSLLSPFKTAYDNGIPESCFNSAPVLY